MKINLLLTLLVIVGLCPSTMLAGSAEYLHETKLHPALSDTTKVAADTTKVSELAPTPVTPGIPEELIKDRLSCLQTSIPLTYNTYVRQFIDYFTLRNRKYTTVMLQRENVYFPLFEKYLAKYNLPQELKYLAVVESGLNPKAVSRTKAKGLWQFMAPTANDYRLVQNQYLDERLDPEKSTEAACRFLKALHGMFGDWQVALAAYNCGPGNVRKAIRRAGGTVNFWSIFPFLPQETRGYVPSFIAITYAMNYAPEHGLIPDTLFYAQHTDTMLVNQYLDLERFSQHLCLSKEDLMTLNPALKVSYIPEHFRNFPLKVPAHTTEFIAQNRFWLYDSCRKAVATPPALLAILPAELQPDKPAEIQYKTKKVFYKVRKGDILATIARKHQVSVTQVKKWNKLKNTQIRAGQSLVLYKSVAVPVKTPATDLKLASSKPAKPAITETATEEKASAQNTYLVQPGDTLFNISKRFQGLTVEQLKKLNNLKGNDIKVGQKLIIG